MASNDEIWIANDHGGFKLKPSILKFLDEKNIPFKNIGTDSEEIVRYPYYAATVAQAVSKKIIKRGILICSTGIGMCIAANKFSDVRASLCTGTYMAKMTRKHNDSNILCLGGRITGDFEALDILETWLYTEFEGGRHNISLGLIDELEKDICNPDGWDSDFLNNRK